MPLPDNTSDAVAYSAELGYYGPITGQIFSEDFAQSLIDASHAAGQVVEGIDFAAGQWGFGSDEPHEITAAENQANLDIAAAQAMEAAGLTKETRDTWTQSDAVQYIQNFKDLILQNAYRFTPATVQMAQNIRITPDLSTNAGNYFRNPVAMIVQITDLLAPAVDLVTPLATIPSTLANASRATLDAANAIANATSKAAEALNKSTGLAPLLVPIALFGALFLAANAFGRDPGGQGKKFISAFV